MEYLFLHSFNLIYPEYSHQSHSRFSIIIQFLNLYSMPSVYSSSCIKLALLQFDQLQQMEGEKQSKEERKKPKSRLRSEATDPSTFQPPRKKSKTEVTPEKLEADIEKPVTVPLPTEETKTASVNWTDGKRIFVNRLGLYSLDSVQPHFLSFADVLHPNLGKAPVLDESNKIEKVIFTTFVYEQELIQKLIDAKIPIVVVKDREGGLHAKLAKDSIHPNLTFAFPEKGPGLGYGVFHAKVILVQFPNFLRVVVTSANLTIVDWTLLSQVIWLQDFPRTKLSITETEKQEFFIQLNDFIKHCFPKNFDPPINVYNYDYSSAAVDLVVSISGRFPKDMMHKYGFPRIGDIVAKSGTKFPSKPILTYQTSSIGTMKQKYLNDLYNAWIGNKKVTMPIVDLSRYIEIQYPTKTYIKNCVLGPEAASCVILSKKVYADKEFPHNCFCKLEPLDTHSKYKGHLFHAKVGILAVNHVVDDNTLIYMGSHNISSSAWGKMEKGNTQICIANYEVGVVFKPKVGSGELKRNAVKALMFKYPPGKYGAKDLPWIYEEYLEKEAQNIECEVGVHFKLLLLFFMWDSKNTYRISLTL
eukprot:TRINITY_DN72030_c3_g1_i1.p1 TRINITY_DN72030_c3_g1~~TRINITY_DN72030_c3_g1_i1.p1  ORF type:complete len:585 (-),score=32.20 TRINITY_DN72030_c3_g1_i1:1359-3113(-)